MKSRKWVRKTVEGSWLTGAFFARYWLNIMIVVALMLIYMTNRYSCQRSMEEIKTLQNRLDVVKSESYRVRGEYMSRTKESNMQRYVNEAGLDLSVQTQPPYHVKL